MWTVDELPNTLELLYRGENEVTQFQFDFSVWTEKYGSGTFTIRHKRPKDDNAYVVPTVTVEENVATWTVTETDTAVNGYGMAELWYAVDDKKKASELIATVTHDSLAETGEAPEPMQDWLDQFSTMVSDAQQAVTDAQAQVTLAADQVTLAQSEVAKAKGYADDAEQSAQDAYNVFSFVDDGDGNVTIERAQHG